MRKSNRKKYGSMKKKPKAFKLVMPGEPGQVLRSIDGVYKWTNK